MKLLIVDDHPIVISGCRSLFSKDRNVKVFEALSIAGARAAMKKLTPDIVIIDDKLADGSGLDFAREIKSQNSSVRTVVFSTTDTPHLALEAIECGAMGFVCKTGAAADIRHAVRAAARGERWLSDNIAQQVALLKVRAEEPAVSLTQRELKVMKLLAQGGRTKEISDEMGISRKTVANICAALKKKFNARTSSEVIRIAIDLELL